ncbi:hypothetical protein WA026_013692 [Henosepilachna vigintioctopunctata]|uniref:Uncharacterized protein n=1 Tax=Henosepilachna vigintioctopunctata TaxID=420089 RepID=A0AAW1UTL4_9CUCU
MNNSIFSFAYKASLISKLKGKQLQDIEVNFEKKLLCDEENNEIEDERLSEEKEIVLNIIGQVELDQERSRTKTHVLLYHERKFRKILSRLSLPNILQRKNLSGNENASN